MSVDRVAANQGSAAHGQPLPFVWSHTFLDPGIHISGRDLTFTGRAAKSRIGALDSIHPRHHSGSHELAWYAYSLRFEGFRFPDGLPLQPCDLTLWLTVFALFSLNPFVFETAYFAGLGGSGMALLTPDLWAPLASYPTIYFFLAHGMVVVCLLMVLWSQQAKPRPGSLWKVFAALNTYAAAIAVFNAIFNTNYMYLWRKPAAASIIDVLGPWPVYLFGCEAVTLAIFWLLWLPVRSQASRIDSGLAEERKSIAR